MRFRTCTLRIVVLIIGILIAGVTQGSRLVRQSRIKTAQNLTSNSPVSSIPNLALWLEPTLDNAIKTTTNGTNPENGDLVNAWNDNNQQNAAKINFIQSVAGQYPAYILNGINGLPTLSFNSSNSNGLVSSQSPITAGNPGYTMFAVWQPTTMGQNAIFAQSDGSSCNGATAGLMMQPNSGSFLTAWACGLGWDYWNVITVSANNSYISSVRVNKALSSNIIQIYFNTLQPSLSGTPSNGVAKVTSGISTIGYASSGGAYFNGYISEVIVFDRALKASEITDIQNYLSQKYAIKLN